MKRDRRERRTEIRLADGRRVTIGAGVDIDPGGWLLHDTGLLRWLTAGDCRAFAAEFQAIATHLDANPTRRP